MIMIDSTTAVVYTPGDLSNAISVDNGINYVYLGDNITMTSGIRIHPTKMSFVINGQHPSESTDFHILTDAGYDGGQIYVDASQNLNFTFQNLIIEGRNYFGMPYVHNYAGSENVTLTYQNVTYTGPQIVYHQRGLTRFIDCQVTITGAPSPSVHEVGEVCKVEIGGLTTMRKTNTDNAVFWFYGSSTRKPYLKILSGAEVAITTAHYFMYESYPPDYIIESGASLTLNTNSGISYTSAHTVASFLVGENASFRYTQATSRTYAALYLDGALTAGEGASFYMQADFANNYPLIRFTGAAAGLYLNNPRSFALYNRGGAQATAFSFAALIPFVFAGNQINMWDTPMAFPAAGTFDDTPQYKWKRPRYNPFRVTGRTGDSQTYVDAHDFTQEELEQMPPLEDLKLFQAIVFSEGNLQLSVNPVVIGVRPITGRTVRRARVRVLRAAGDPYPDRDADDDGFFSVMPTDPVPFAEMFTVASNTPFLITTLMVESQEERGLTIIEAPEYIQFVLPPLEGFSDIILRRQISDAPVVVWDDRIDKTQWVLWVKIAGPLKTEENEILDDAVVFLREGGDLITLGTEFVPIHTDGPYPDVYDKAVTWADNRGVLVRVTVPIRSGRRYTTQLSWVVYPIGVEPEGSD